MICELPIPLTKLVDIMLRVSNAIGGKCDHTLVHTTLNLDDSQDLENVLSWFEQHGVRCDCRAVLFVANLSSELMPIFHEKNRSEKYYVFGENEIKK